MSFSSSSWIRLLARFFHCSRPRAYAHSFPTRRSSDLAEAHIASCPNCRRELESLRPVVGRFVSWPTDVLRPVTRAHVRTPLRVAARTPSYAVQPTPPRGSEPQREQVAPGIECTPLATD